MVGDGMNTITIYGDNRYEKHTKERIACRGIIIKDGKILLSYEENTDQWFIPGGGIEENESLEECCIREVAEETGYLIEIDKMYLTINEYYEEWFFQNNYFVCKIIGTTDKNLTEREIEVGLKPRWLPLEEAIAIYAKHNEYALVNEMKRGGYLREHTALMKYKKEK